jgi:hypothetical protein
MHNRAGYACGLRVMVHAVLRHEFEHFAAHAAATKPKKKLTPEQSQRRDRNTCGKRASTCRACTAARIE